VRQARRARGLTQAQLAAAARVSRTTLNQLENGLFPDLGFKKLQALLEQLGFTLSVEQASTQRGADFVRMACIAANVSYESELTENELIRTFLTGKILQGKRPHIRLLLEEAPPSLLQGLIRELSRWAKPGRVEKNVTKIAHDIGSARNVEEWLKTV
jgi:transcriptional regulator with XRE-family HTH domain